MQFKCDEYLWDANCYSIEIYQKPLTEHDFLNVVVNKINYYCRKTGVSWLAVYSTTESDTAKQTVERTGKRGRPKKLVQGVKTGGHVHNCIVGTKSKSAYSTVQEIKKSINKKYGGNVCKIISKGKGDHAYNWVNYCMKQADIIRTGGDLDFEDLIMKERFF